MRSGASGNSKFRNLVGGKCVRPNRSGNILDLLIALIDERIGQLVPNFVIDLRRHTNAAGRGKPFETSGYVHTVAINVALVNDQIADVQANAEDDSVLWS